MEVDNKVILERVEIMILNLKLVRVDSKYCDYLRIYDSRVPYNKLEKELRPFIGILFKINEIEYFAPLSSPKPKHKLMKNTMDFLKIKEGELGAVNFNNMIPLKESNYVIIDLNKKSVSSSERKYHNLLKSQLAWLNANYYQVKNKSAKLYKLYNSGRIPDGIKNRCCNFKLLEEKCMEYNSK